MGNNSIIGFFQEGGVVHVPYSARVSRGHRHCD